MARLSTASSGSPGNGEPTGALTATADSSGPAITYRRQADSDSETDRDKSTAASSTSSSSRSPPFDPSLLPKGSRSLSSIAVQAFGLGFVLAACLAALALAVSKGASIWRLPAFIACLSVFHFLEFWTTAHYNLPNARASSFLLWNNREYTYAHAMATAEMLVLHFGFPRFQGYGVNSFSISLGVLLVAVGQLVRSAAMITAGTNFNHIPAKAHKQGHELVQTGIYARLRHPSYFGFFWWALGTQVLVGNKVCLIGYLLVLWRFFYRRIQAEERYLVNFFGKDYEAYRARVRTGIPFIK